MTHGMDVEELLAGAPNGGFTLERIGRGGFEAPLLSELHELATTLMSEPLDHFAWHAHTNDELHVFRRRGSGRVEGFQFWRWLASRDGTRRLVLGGKLRIRPEARRCGLHLASGLSVLASQRRSVTDLPVTRIGVASLFGFVSIARRLHRYDFVDEAGPRRDLVDDVRELTEVSRYRFDPATGQVDVGIFMTEAQLSGYPRSFFQRPEAQAYIARNPDFRHNGRYLSFAFDADDDNMAAIARGTARAVLGDSPERDAVASALWTPAG